MKYYQDISLLPDAEVNLGFLWQKVYQQLHLALVEIKTVDNKSEIAISLPEYCDKQPAKNETDKFPLGNKLRLFAVTQEQLQQLDVAKWLNRLTDYTHVTSIKEVPLSADKFVYFKRKQFDTNVDRLARRRAKRKGESFEQALKYYTNFKDQKTRLPFVNMLSLSSNKNLIFSEKKKFRLFIEREIVDQESVGEFSCYGLSSRELSKQATVPLF